MASLQVFPGESQSSTPAHTRSPSPAIPGGWPRTPGNRTPVHKRSHTCPSLSIPQSLTVPPVPTSSATSPERLHLARVADFHQRLSLTLSEPLNTHDSRSSFAPVQSGEPISSYPSDASDFNKYTQVSVPHFMPRLPLNILPQDGNSSSLAVSSF